MKTKLKDYIDTVFADAERRAPYDGAIRELKEEMLQNLYDRYDDLVASGKSPAGAYNAAVAGVGDVSELLDSMVGGRSAVSDGGSARVDGDRQSAPPLTEEERTAWARYKKRSAVLTALAVSAYILCWIPLVVLGALLGDVGGAVGLAVMFLMIAGATATLIFVGMTKPKSAGGRRGGDGDDDDDDDDDDEPRSPLCKAIVGGIWILTLCAYLIVSNVTGYWHITWMMFLMATALEGIVKAIFDLRR